MFRTPPPFNRVYQDGLAGVCLPPLAPKIPANSIESLSIYLENVKCCIAAVTEKKKGGFVSKDDGKKKGGGGE